MYWVLLAFSNVQAHYRHELVFFLEIFKVKRGCALCTNPHYATLNTVFDLEVKDLGPTKVITVCDTPPYGHAPTYQINTI
jgi:hypothetical protein